MGRENNLTKAARQENQRILKPPLPRAMTLDPQGASQHAIPPESRHWTFVTYSAGL